jgi:hypothetical protein
LAIFIAALPALANDLSFTLGSNIGVGVAPRIAPEPDPPCLPSACVLFTGTLTDNDTDGSYFYTGPQTGLGPDEDLNLNDISLTWSTSPASGGLTLDQTWDEYAQNSGAALLVGDPNGLADVGVPNSYSGSVFGIDIAPGTSVGEYTGTVTIQAQRFTVDSNGDFDPDGSPFTVSEQFTVVVAPEPATWGFAMAGLAALGACCGLRRKRTGLTTSEEARSALSRIRRANRLRLWSVRCAREEKWRSSAASF